MYQTMLFIADHLIQFVFSFVLAVITPVAIDMVKKYAANLHINTTSTQEALMASWIAQGASILEQKLQKAIEAKEIPMAHGAQVQTVIDFVMSQVNSHNLVPKAEQDLISMIESAFHVKNTAAKAAGRAPIFPA